MFWWAIEDAMRRGFEDGLIKAADCGDAPDERCPLRPKDGCVCYHRAYEAAPFWRRWRMEPPHRPSQDKVLDAVVEIAIERATRRPLP